MNKEEIIAIRTALEMNQRQFAFALGTTVTTISRWENGHAIVSPAYEKEIKRLKDRNAL